MYKLIALLLSLSLIACSTGTEQKATGQEDAHADHSHHSTPGDSTASKPRPKSPKQMAMTTVGDNHIHIEYSAPSMRGRQIFGGLVAWGEVWVTGAHKATNITFAQDVEINSTTIPAGKYGFFTIPGEDTWTIILSKDWDMHLADEYTEASDILRFEVSPEQLQEPVETLNYTITATDEQRGTITIAWADVAISFEVKNQ